jgi:cell division septation protein DedD
MPSRDSQTVILSRQTILLVTAMGVGLLTLCYVLGVQVGKQSAALRRPASRGSGEELQELPASIADQLKSLEENGGDPGFQKPLSAPAPGGNAPAGAAAAGAGTPAPAVKTPPPVEKRLPTAPAQTNAKAKTESGKTASAKPAAAKSEAGDSRPVEGGRWTLQLISTPDQEEAKRMAAKAQDAGFPAQVVSEKGLFKVRLLQSQDRTDADATATRLRNRGFRPFAMKVE